MPWVRVAVICSLQTISTSFSFTNVGIIPATPAKVTKALQYIFPLEGSVICGGISDLAAFVSSMTTLNASSSTVWFWSNRSLTLCLTLKSFTSYLSLAIVQASFFIAWFSRYVSASKSFLISSLNLTYSPFCVLFGSFPMIMLAGPYLPTNYFF